MTKRVRDTVTGKYVDKGEAKNRPATTVVETGKELPPLLKMTVMDVDTLYAEWEAQLRAADEDATTAESINTAHDELTATLLNVWPKISKYLKGE